MKTYLKISELKEGDSFKFLEATPKGVTTHNRWFIYLRTVGSQSFYTDGKIGVEYSTYSFRNIHKC